MKASGTGSHHPASIFATLRSLWRHVPARRKRQLVWLFALMLAAAFSEIVSLGAILPFLHVLAAPDRLMQHETAAWLLTMLGLTAPGQVVLALTLVFCGAALVSGGLRLVVLWASTRLSQGIGHDLAVEAYRRTLHQPYEVHTRLNSSRVISGLGKSKVANAAISTVLKMLSSFVLLVALGGALLLLLDGVVALAAVACCAGLYVLMTRLVRKTLQRNGKQVAVYQVQTQKAVQEGLGGIRDVLLTGSQAVYCGVFQRAEARVNHAQSNIGFLSQCPRYIVEALGMIAIALVAYTLSRRPGGLIEALPVLAALALAAQRLFPALQQLFTGWALLKGKQASVAHLVELLDMPLGSEHALPRPSPLVLEREVRFENVSFRYAGSSAMVLDGIDLVIEKGAKVGLVGTTGSGKSTVLDLLTGLLEPTSGKILVDGRPLDGSSRRAWQESLSHVSQNIYLSDASFAENIAFGLPPKSIDMDRVRRAARGAQIADFIESLPARYETPVGERGIQLSGGQRQRVAIARALYRKASVLILDEATSALDNETESAVMEVMSKLGDDMTIVLVAHRLTSVRDVDQIVVIEGGRVVASGGYHEILGEGGMLRWLRAS